MSEKSDHTSVTGYTMDCEKYNLTTLMVWKVLKYTALNYKQVLCDIEEYTLIGKLEHSAKVIDDWFNDSEEND